MDEQCYCNIRWKSVVKLSVWTLLVGFGLNLVWENAQAFLYDGYGDFVEHFWICFVAAVIDGLVVLLLYLLLTLIYQDLYWPRRNRKTRYAVAALIAGVLAVGFELWALKTGAWEYTPRMPVVPELGIGLSPLVQLVVLPVLTYHITLATVKAER